VRRAALGLGALALAALLGLAGLWMLQDFFIFHPARRIEATPGFFGLPFEPVRLTASDGVEISGWYIPAPDAVATLLFLHGNAGNIGNRITDIAALRRAGFATLIIDYRGYGDSSGRPSVDGLHRDARAGWSWLTAQRGLAPGRIALYGESLGSVPALELARELQREQGPPAAVILVGAFTSGLEMGRHHYPFLPVRLVLRSRLDNLSAIGEVTVPTLLIHGEQDEVVPIEMGLRLFEVSPATLKELITIPRASHNSLWMDRDREYMERFRSFVSAAIAAGT
jgi:fermentation-respiration switch protein FrsA (DUF1100 family)